MNCGLFFVGARTPSSHLPRISKVHLQSPSGVSAVLGIGGLRTPAAFHQNIIPIIPCSGQCASSRPGSHARARLIPSTLSEVRGASWSTLGYCFVSFHRARAERTERETELPGGAGCARRLYAMEARTLVEIRQLSLIPAFMPWLNSLAALR
ncbi:hypothetical protein C8R45DRAFT_559113 [Mycena sanguinolenta]|nr:hypothetical protein C8R45DRAFT_559113 [Mycena sanguinolenta]